MDKIKNFLNFKNSKNSLKKQKNTCILTSLVYTFAVLFINL